MIIIMRAVVFLLVAVLGISWTQASVIIQFRRNQKSAFQIRPDNFDNSTNSTDKNKYALSEDSESKDGRSPGVQNKYDEAEIFKIYDYITNPQDKYIELISPTSFTFGSAAPSNDSDKVKATLGVSNLQDILKKPTMKNTLIITEIALKRVKESFDELEKRLNMHLNNGEPTALQNSSKSTRLALEENQHVTRFVLQNISTDKILLQNLQKILDGFKVSSDDTNFLKSVDGITLDVLIHYTALIITTVRGSWKEWYLILHHAEEIAAKP